jgi:hypothetical protein
MRERLAQAAEVDTSYVSSRRELDQVRRTINAVFSTVDLLSNTDNASATDYN